MVAGVGDPRKVPVDGQEAQTVDDCRHPAAVSGVGTAGVDADAVRIDVVDLNLVAVYQPTGAGTGQIGGCPIGGTAGCAVAHLQPDGSVAVGRYVHRGIEREGDVDVLAVAVGVTVAREGNDVRPVGAVRTRAALDPHPENLVRVGIQ